MHGAFTMYPNSAIKPHQSTAKQLEVLAVHNCRRRRRTSRPRSRSPADHRRKSRSKKRKYTSGGPLGYVFSMAIGNVHVNPSSMAVGIVLRAQVRAASFNVPPEHILISALAGVHRKSNKTLDLNHNTSYFSRYQSVTHKFLEKIKWGRNKRELSGAIMLSIISNAII
ncbi:uncharacterized protein EDB93DRAFT_689553 [Suillus bovinus]|uniref:uncharacterized protein n=1 Tax=Suillus bovinus TaxID=48563 RepID=UPI001B8779FE|nr:uncharacterized protein EDB93DRAFT_689553 [Suillus bovinus]KAG2139805.1 hypothetical protein EDB93DRAFT_689553 [Suillus bovinus]